MRVAIAADSLMDGSGGPPQLDPAVVIDRGRIVEVTSIQGLGSDPGIPVHRHRGTILPGFVEMHAHLMWDGGPRRKDPPAVEELENQARRSMAASLASGVTTLRDLGAAGAIGFRMKEEQGRGLLAGPRLKVAGRVLTTSKGHGHMFGIEADGPDQLIAAVRAQAELGADWIKIMASGGGTPGTDARRPQFAADALAVVVGEADRAGIPVAAHCHATESIRRCVAAGVRSLEHCSWLGPTDGTLWDFDRSLAEEIARQGIYVDPTHALIHLNELRTGSLPAKGTMADPDGRYRILREMWDIGVRFITGSDAGIPNVRHDDFAWTPRLMVQKLGIPVRAAVAAATSVSAACLGLDDEIGLVAPGMRADLVIVDGDVDRDVGALGRVAAVYQDGIAVAEHGRLSPVR